MARVVQSNINGNEFTGHCPTCRHIELGPSLDATIEGFFEWAKGDEGRPCPKCGTPVVVDLHEDRRPCEASITCWRCQHVEIAKDIDGAWSAFQWWARIDADKAAAPSIADQYPHYFRRSPSQTIDVYRVLQLFAVTDPCIGHAIKKLLVAGMRGEKAAMGQTVEKDVAEAIVTLRRWQEMRAEEAGASAGASQSEAG